MNCCFKRIIWGWWRTVVDIVQRFVWVVWIINNQRTTQPITVLVPEMTVIPVCTLGWDNSGLVKYLVSKTRKVYRLVWRIELVHKALLRYERTLSHAYRTVSVVRTLLLDTVPMLQIKCVQLPTFLEHNKNKHTMEVPRSRLPSVSWSITLTANPSPCIKVSQNYRYENIPVYRTSPFSRR